MVAAGTAVSLAGAALPLRCVRRFPTGGLPGLLAQCPAEVLQADTLLLDDVTQVGAALDLLLQVILADPGELGRDLQEAPRPIGIERRWPAES